MLFLAGCIRAGFFLSVAIVTVSFMSKNKMLQQMHYFFLFSCIAATVILKKSLRKD